MKNPHEKIKKEIPESPSSFAKSVPLSQSESLRAYREKKKIYYDTYLKFWEERRRAEAAWAEDKSHDPYWLEINPDDLEEGDYFYFKLLATGKVSADEAERVLKEEYWPSVEKHLKEASAGAAERAKKLDRQFSLQDFHEHDSKFNFYQWLLNKVTRVVVQKSSATKSK